MYIYIIILYIPLSLSLPIYFLSIKHWERIRMQWTIYKPLEFLQWPIMTKRLGVHRGAPFGLSGCSPDCHLRAGFEESACGSLTDASHRAQAAWHTCQWAPGSSLLLSAEAVADSGLAAFLVALAVARVDVSSGTSIGPLLQWGSWTLHHRRGRSSCDE